jgi:hypothetical protein
METYTFSNLFTYAYIDADNSMPYQTISYCKVQLTKTLSDSLQEGKNFETVQLNLETMTLTFMPDYTDEDSYIQYHIRF